jgi:hypothetical protein
VGADRQQRDLDRVLVTYLVAFGAARRAGRGGFTTGQELLLGLGSTLGIAVQLLILLPYLRSAGFATGRASTSAAPGSGTPCGWASGPCCSSWSTRSPTRVVRLASSGTAGGRRRRRHRLHVYSSAFLLVMVPHAIVTVSLATAILPRLAPRRSGRPGRRWPATLASHAAHRAGADLPFAALLPVIAPDLAGVLFGLRRRASRLERLRTDAGAVRRRLVFFTVHYLMLRGFYALERTAPSSGSSALIAAVNIVAAVVLVARDRRRADLARAGDRLHRVVRRRRGRLLRSCCAPVSAAWRRRLVRFVVRCVAAASPRRGRAVGLGRLPGLLGDDPTIQAVRGRPGSVGAASAGLPPAARAHADPTRSRAVETVGIPGLLTLRPNMGDAAGTGGGGEGVPSDATRRRPRRPVPPGRPAHESGAAGSGGLRPVLERARRAARDPGDDDRAPLLRRPPALGHRARPRILRVLDIDDTDGLCFVVNEWGSGTSLDIMLATRAARPRGPPGSSPRSPTSIAAAHAAGVAHGRLVPENVLIDTDGAVR